MHLFSSKAKEVNILDKPNDILQSVLIDKLNVDIAIGNVEKYIKESEQSSFYMPIIRTLWAYREGKIVDFVVILDNV